MVIIFDNNAYRDLVAAIGLTDVNNVVAALSAEQRSHGHLSVASPVVAMELLARLQGGNTRAFDSALKAIVALVGNCQDTARPEVPIRILMDPDANMCLALFDQLPPDAEANIDRLTWLLRRVAEVRGPDLGDDAWALVASIREHVDRTESSFISDTFTDVVEPLNPGIDSWEELQRRPDLSASVLEALSDQQWPRAFARQQVLKAADALARTLTETEIEERTVWLIPYLRAPLTLYSEMVKRVLVDGARLTAKNRANWFWDVVLLQPNPDFRANLGSYTFRWSRKGTACYRPEGISW